MRARKLPAAMACAAVMVMATCQLGCTARPPSVTPAPVTAAAKEALDVGVASDQPGLDLEAADGTHRRSGFDYDLALWIANQHHMAVNFTDLTVAQRIPALEQGKGGIDIVIDSFSITDKRRSQISFAGPYVVTRQGIMVRAGDTRIARARDLGGKQVCAVTKSTSLAQLEGLNTGLLHGDPMSITIEDSFTQCMTDLLTDKTVEAVSTDQLLLAGIAAHEPANAVTVLPQATFGEEERYGIGLPRGDVTDCNKYTADLQGFIISGQWQTDFQLEFPELKTQWQAFQPNPSYLDPCQ